MLLKAFARIYHAWRKTTYQSQEQRLTQCQSLLVHTLRSPPFPFSQYLQRGFRGFANTMANKQPPAMKAAHPFFVKKQPTVHVISLSHRQWPRSVTLLIKKMLWWLWLTYCEGKGEKTYSIAQFSPWMIVSPTVAVLDAAALTYLNICLYIVQKSVNRQQMYPSHF